MNRFLLSVALLLSVFSAAYGIKCYVCTGEGDKCTKDKLTDKMAMDCGSGFDKCLRVWAKKDDSTAVAATCANQLACDAAKKTCDDIKDGECKVGCCDKDLCNAATPVSFSLFLMTVCSVFGLILLK